MWVIITLAALAVLIGLILCVPLEAVFRLDVYGKPAFSLRLVWLFGLISRELKRDGKKPSEAKQIAKKKPKKKRRVGLGTMLQILKIRGLFKQIRYLVKDLVRQFRFREFTANFRIGLGNPADTGLLFAIIGPATPFFNSRVTLRPAFDDEPVLEGFSHGSVRLRPIGLIGALLKAVFSLTTLRVAKVLISSRWRKK